MLTEMRYTPESRGISSRALLNFLKKVNRKKIPMHSLVIAKGDDIILDAYWAPFEKNKLHRMNSVTKSFVGLTIGLLIDEGRLNYNDKVIDFFPEAAEYNVTEAKREETVYDLLTMKTSYVLVPGQHWVRYKRYNRIKDYFEDKAFKPRQTLFYYDSPASYILGVIAERITGESFISYLYKRVLSKIGFSEHTTCIKDAFGYSWGDSGLLCTAQDLAKVARLIQNRGKWGGEQLISEKFISEAIKSHGASCVDGNDANPGNYGYGFQIWVERDGGFGFHGMGMQYMICYPEKDIVMACCADTQGNDAARSIFLDMYNDFVLEEIKSAPIPEDPEGYKLLCDYIKEMKLVCLDGTVSSDIAGLIEGKIIRLNENPMGIKWMSLRFEEHFGVLSYENSQGKKELPFGVCSNVFGEFPEDGYDNLTIGEAPLGYHHPCAVSGAWQDEKTFAIKAQMIGNHLGGLYIRIAFNKNNVGIHMSKSTECFLNEYSGYAIGKLEE